MQHSGRVYIFASVRFNENSFFFFTNDPKFHTQESTSQNDFSTLFERFQVVSFSIDDSQKLTQTAATRSHSQDIPRKFEHSQNLD